MNWLYTREHPSLEELALHFRGDLPLFRARKVRAHIRSCPDCEREVARFQAADAALKRQSGFQMLTGLRSLDWSRLEAEMIGNIRVGIAAAQCIDHVPRRYFHNWRRTAVAGALLILFVAGWIVNMPHADSGRILDAFRTAFSGPQVRGRIVLATTPQGISVRSQGASLTLLHPATVRATASFTSSSSVGMRYIDEETGQVTITNVYGQ